LSLRIWPLTANPKALDRLSFGEGLWALGVLVAVFIAMICGAEWIDAAAPGFFAENFN
jgi:hypothetical protein